jgi:hypothetical protein
MKAIFMAVILVVDLGFLFAQEEPHPVAAVSAKRNPRSLQGVTITGQLVDARTFQPLRGAIVSAARVPTEKPGASPNIGFRTGEDGKFILRGVAPGIVNFYVAKAGYAPGPYPSVRPAVDGERIDNVILTVLPGASISGRVVDESSQPVAGMKVRIAAGGQSDQTATGSSDRSQFHRGLVTASRDTVVTTDDDGNYWAGGLAAGTYEVTVIQEARTIIQTRDGDEIVMGGGGVIAERSQPAPATLATGEDRTGVDLVARFVPFGSRSGALKTETGTGRVSGRVIDSLGRGVPSATVTLTSPVGNLGTITATTNSDGAFRIIQLPDGTFVLRVVRSDSVAWLNSSQTTTATVTGGSRVENVVLTVGRSGVISGTITDEFGEPVAAEVTVIASRSDGLVSGGMVTADARGRYRIPLLRPGEYLLSAQPIAAGEVHFDDYVGQDRILARAPLFYPGVPKASLASPLAVAEGAESAGVDFVLRPTSAGSVIVTLDAGRPVDDIQLRYVTLDDRSAALNMTPVTGSQVTLDLRPGRYRLVASADVPSGNDVIRLWSSTTVETDTLLQTSVSMMLEPGTNVSGRVIFEASGSAPPQGIRPSLLPAVSGPRLGFAPGNSTYDAATGAFSIEGVLPGRYVIQAGERGSPWMLKGATIDGRDILDLPIDFNPGAELDKVVLTVTDRLSELSVTLTDAVARSSLEELAVVFSADQKYWYPGSRRVRVVPQNDKRMYVVRGVPAGAYLVALTPNSLSQDDSLPLTLQALAGSGVRVTLTEGEKKVLNVRR